MDAVFYLEIVLRLVLAGVLGGAVGYQREHAEKPAGLRTHLLVCLGAALIMLVSVYPFADRPNVDVSRIAAQVVTGVGFLGAGAIIRQGSIIRGLTTAASLWAVAGVGLAVGVGFYVPAVAATALILIALSTIKRLEILAVRGQAAVSLVTIDRPGQLGNIGTALGSLGVNIKAVEIDPAGDDNVAIRLVLEIPSGVERRRVAEELSNIRGISSLSWEG